MNHATPPVLDATLAALGLVFLLAGCGAPFTSPGGAGGGGGASGGTTTSGAGAACDANNACGPGFFCFDAGCGAAVLAGTCQAVEANATEMALMCGCNGVTYWNSHFAATSSRSMRAAGTCAKGMIKTCNSSGQSLCATALGERCVYAASSCGGGLPQGACWVAPTDCGGTQATAKRCDGSKPSCDKLCEIINDGGKAFRDVNGCSL